MTLDEKCCNFVSSNKNNKDMEAKNFWNITNNTENQLPPLPEEIEIDLTSIN